MSNTWAVRKAVIILAVMMSTASPVLTERQREVDFSPFGSEDVNEPSQSQIVIDRSPIISQLQMDGGNITESFQIISDKTGWSIFPTEEVSKAKISLFVKDVSAQQLLDTVVKLAGFIYNRQDNVVTVMTYDEYAEFYGLEKKIITLNHADAESVAAVSKTFLSKRGKSVVHSQTNTIVLLDSSANLETIVHMIDELDIPTEPEATITVIDLQYMDAELLAEKLQQIFSNKEPNYNPVVARKEDEKSNPSSERITGPRIVKEQSLISPKSSVEVFAIGRTNQLIAKALQSDMDELKDLVKILDVYVEPTTQSYHFTYVDASEVYNGLEEILDLPTRANRYGRATGQGREQGGRPGGLTLVTRTNSILLTAPPSVHRVMASIAKSVDVPGMYEAGMIRVYKLENADVDEVAGAIRELIEGRDRQEKETGEPKYKTAASEGGPQTTGTPELSKTEEFVPQIEARVTVSKSTNSVIIQATEREHRELEKLIKELDKRQKQVLIKAVIVEVTTNDDLDVGVEIDHFQGDPIAFTSFGLSTIDPTTGVRDVIVSPGGTAAVLNPDKVQAIFKALQGKDNVRIESAPQILVNNNAVGTIMSIAEEPTRQTNQGQTTTTTSFGQYVTAGTQFYVTPHISESDYLLVDYQIMLNSFGKQADPELPPARNTSTIQGRATVPSGSTIIVGGIQSSNDTESVDKVPILGDIPIVGLAFRNTAIRKQRITTYLFISTTIMENESFDDLKGVSDKVIDKVKENGSGQTLDMDSKEFE